MNTGLEDKGLHLNYFILFWAILDTPLPPDIMLSFDTPPRGDDVIYVQLLKDTHEIAMHKWKDNKCEHQSDQIRI